MGRLYEKEMVGDKTIGYFSNGSVTRGQGVMSDTSTVVKYSNGHIYGNWMGSSLSNQIAYCDEYGNLYKGNGGGSVLAKLENGIVYDAPGYGRKEIARYEGDMYGAAAAVAALMLGLANESGKSSVQNETSQSASNETGGGSASSSEEFSVVKFIIAVLLFIPMLVISIIKFVFKAMKFILTSPKFTMFAVTICMIISLWCRIINGFQSYLLAYIGWTIIDLINLFAAINLNISSKKQIIADKCAKVLIIVQNLTWLFTLLRSVILSGTYIILRLQGKNYRDFQFPDFVYTLLNPTISFAMGHFSLIDICIIISTIIVLTTLHLAKKKAQKQETLQSTTETN